MINLDRHRTIFVFGRVTSWPLEKPPICRKYIYIYTYINPPLVLLHWTLNLRSWRVWLSIWPAGTIGPPRRQYTLTDPTGSIRLSLLPSMHPLCPQCNIKTYKTRHIVVIHCDGSLTKNDWEWKKKKSITLMVIKKNN